MNRIALLMIGLLAVGSYACSDGGPTSANLNNAPNLGQVSAVAVAGGETEGVTISATDLDGDALTLGITGGTGASWTSIANPSQTDNTVTATLVVSPSLYTVGSYSVTVEARDEHGSSDSQDVDIVVEESPFLMLGDGADDLDDTFTAVVDDNDGFHSLEYFSNFITNAIYPGSPVLDLMPETPLGGIPGATPPASTVLNLLGSLAALPARLPSEVLGTWEWSTDSYSYVRTSSTPSDRARFALYAINPNSGTLILPLVEIGYFDIIDDGSPPAIVIRAEAVVNDVTVISVAATGSFSTVLDLELVGEVNTADGPESLAFNIDLLVTYSTVEIDILAVLGGYTVDYSLASEGDVETIVVTVTDGVDTAIVGTEFDYGDMSMAGYVRVNGTLCATFEGNLNTGVINFFDDEGNPLALAKANLVYSIFFSFAGFEEFFLGLIDFAMALSGLY
jgi:hypothetical protein